MTFPDHEPAGFAALAITNSGPWPADRMLEIGMVLLDADGHETDAWTTLVRPDNHTSLAPVAGIDPAVLATAPTFEQIAPRVLADLSGRVLVAHNLRLARQDLLTELSAIGIDLIAPVGVCTLEFSLGLLTVDHHDLSSCCRAAGVAAPVTVDALAAARSTAALLAALLITPGAAAHLTVLQQRAAARVTPALAAVPVTLVPRPAFVRDPAREADFVSALIASLPEPFCTTDDADTAVYSDMLARILSDGRLEEHEVGELSEAAAMLGVSAQVVYTVNRGYLRALARAAVADGQLSLAERAQLSWALHVLALDDDELREALRELHAEHLLD